MTVTGGWEGRAERGGRVRRVGEGPSTPLRTGEREVEVRILDSGPGVSPEIVVDLFEPWVTTRFQGTGLGLSICRTIVEAHGGRIWADSAPGGGAAFCFTLAA